MHGLKKKLWDELMILEAQAPLIKGRLTLENLKVIKDTAEAYVYASKASEWHAKEDEEYAEKERKAMKAKEDEYMSNEDNPKRDKML